MKLSRRLIQTVVGTTIAMHASMPMACDPNGYLAVMKPFAGNFAIRNCTFAHGQLLSIASNTALFSLVGTIYGGDGRSTFGLPDTRGRSIVGSGTGPGLTPILLGAKSGSETRTLSVGNLPAHNHTATTTVTAHGSSSGGNTDSPNGAVWAVLDREDQYSTNVPNVTMSATAITATTTISNTGSNTSFNIRDPYIGMNWLIQTSGIFPSRN